MAAARTNDERNQPQFFGKCSSGSNQNPPAGPRPAAKWRREWLSVTRRSRPPPTLLDNVRRTKTGGMLPPSILSAETIASKISHPQNRPLRNSLKQQVYDCEDDYTLWSGKPALILKYVQCASKKVAQHLTDKTQNTRASQRPKVTWPSTRAFRKTALWDTAAAT